MKTRSEKELYIKMDKWEKELVSACFAISSIVYGEEAIKDLCEDLSSAIDYADNVAASVKADFLEYHDIPKRYYELANEIQFLTLDYTDGTYEVDEMPLSIVDDYASKLDKATTDLLYELREEF